MKVLTDEKKIEIMHTKMCIKPHKTNDTMDISFQIISNIDNIQKHPFQGISEESLKQTEHEIEFYYHQWNDPLIWWFLYLFPHVSLEQQTLIFKFVFHYLWI